MPKVEYRFPLILWEQTADYAQKLKEAQDRFVVIRGEVAKRQITGFFPDVTFTSNGIPVVWANAGTPYFEIRGLSADQALKSAKKHGHTGYWDTEDLEAYVKGEGIIIDMEMDELGFRPHKKDLSKWAKKQKGDEFGERHAHWEKLYGTDVHIPEPDEQARLRDLMDVPNAQTRLDYTYSVNVGRTGLIYIAKDFNPFGTLQKFAVDRVQNAHIARDQEGFLIEARNVSLSRRKNNRHDAVHIRAEKDNGHTVEVVWPATASSSAAVVDLAVILRDKARG